MAERYFAPEEVERLIPRLAGSLERVMAAQAAGRQAQEWLDAEQQRITLSGGGVVDQAAWRARRERIELSARAMQTGIEEIQEQNTQILRQLQQEEHGRTALAAGV